MTPPFAYVFERFPSFTQTFCVREVLEMQRQGMRPLIFSIHDVSDEAVQHFPRELMQCVQVLPQEAELVAAVNRLKDERRLPQSAVLTLRHWGERPDKLRVYEAAFIGHRMREAGVRHAHSHFAGIGARTCWWLRQFFHFTYSFTGHANDLFCDAGLPLTLRHLVQDAAVVVTVSDFTANWLRGQFPFARRRVRRVYNGLDLAPITAAARGAAKAQPPLIFSVGRLIEKKGFDDLIRACSHLQKRKVDFQCVIAGDGPLEMELTELIAQTGLEGRVTLAGPQPQEEIVRLLGRASAFALPCVTEKDGGMDNLPTVLMEAMAAALPCASTRLAGVPEMVVHAETGLLCEERRPEDFAALLERLLTNHDEAMRFGRAGLERAGALFAKEKTVAQLAALLVEFGEVPAAGLPVAGAAVQRQRWQRLLRRFQRKPPRKRGIFPEPDGSCRIVAE
ncbi:MAG: glycosyltransferase family 4 protein [Verrucomicrobiales bacterium]|nr:glycosyltransferase family 4 protein [Verrucomicrobiales bacterium]